METGNNLTITNISCALEGTEYVFSISPSPRPSVSQTLRKDATGVEPPVAKAEIPQRLRVAKETLEQLEVAYITLEQGADRSMPVQVFAGTPEVLRVIVKDGTATFLLKDSPALQFPGQFFLRGLADEESCGWAYVKKPECAVRLAVLGLAGVRQKAAAELSFYYQDYNHADVFSASVRVPLFLSGPQITSITTDDHTVVLVTDETSETGAVANLSCSGTDYGPIPLTQTSAGRYTLDLQPLRLPTTGCAVRAAYDDGVCCSPWGAACPLLLEKPECTGLAYSADRVALSFEEVAVYDCGGQQTYSNTLDLPLSNKMAHVRFAGRYGAVTYFGPAVTIPFASPRYYSSGGGFFRGDLPNEDPFSAKRYPLAFPYDAFSNACFALEQGRDSWILVTSADAAKNPRLADCFQALLAAACTGAEAVQKSRELRALVGDMWMKPEDMLFFRSGFYAAEGYCDLQAGEILSAEYSLYQNIPEERYVFDDGIPDHQSDKNLSGFTGVGTADYHVIHRGANLTVEPFLTGMIEAGSFSVPAPEAVDGTSRQCGGAGVLDLLFHELRAPFLRLVYPPTMTERYRASHGSMFYYDNACVLSGADYAHLGSATKSLRGGHAPEAADVAHTFLRGRTALTIRITVAVDGMPLTCSLGTTLGDLMDRFGLLQCPHLFRADHGLGHVPFDKPETALPLCQGDRVVLP